MRTATQPASRQRRKTRKRLSADGLHRLLRGSFERLTDRRGEQISISLTDACLSAFAAFSLKDPSLLAFDARRNDGNLRRLYGIGNIPCDTQMREILDRVLPRELRAAFHDVFRELQRGKVLEPLVFHQGCYLLALDGTGYFSSDKIHCPSCLQKVNSQIGQITYSHQMLAAALLHPDFREVIPLAPEPIVNSDGQAKNDCERNAARRLLEQIRREHPHLKLIVVEDGLASNAPHIRDLQRLKMHFLLGVKPEDHAFLFEEIISAMEQDQEQTMRWQEDDRLCEIVFLNRLPLNRSNSDLLVNYLEYTEYDANLESKKHFSWVTDLEITRGNAQHLVRGGRALEDRE